jgi:coenzyme PQQ biosynthesis protein PqqD
MPTITARSLVRPRPGVRLIFDDVRGRHALLYPEGVLLVNETAAAVFSRCTRTITVAALVAGLRETYDGVAEKDVVALLTRLADDHLLEVLNADDAQ